MSLDQTAKLRSDDRRFNKLEKDAGNLANGYNKYIFPI